MLSGTESPNFGAFGLVKVGISHSGVSVSIFLLALASSLPETREHSISYKSLAFVETQNNRLVATPVQIFFQAFYTFSRDVKTCPLEANSKAQKGWIKQPKSESTYGSKLQANKDEPTKSRTDFRCLWRPEKIM